MSRSIIIKSPDYQADALVVNGRQRSGFTPTLFGESKERLPSPQEEKALQREMLETAKAQAERMVAEAEARVEAIESAAIGRGYEQGLAEGLTAAEEASKEHLQRLAALVDQAIIDRESMTRSAQGELAMLALAIARKILHKEVRTDPTVVLGMVESALERIPGGTHVRVIVSPLDADLVQTSWDQMQGTAVFGSDWEIITDPRLEPGGCIIETRGGRVDSTILTQMQQLEAVFEAEG